MLPEIQDVWGTRIFVQDSIKVAPWLQVWLPWNVHPMVSTLSRHMRRIPISVTKWILESAAFGMGCYRRDITWLSFFVKFDCTMIQLLYLNVQDALHYLILLLSSIVLRPDGLQVTSKTDLELWLLFLIDHYWLLYFSLIPILASCLEVRRDIIAPCCLTRSSYKNYDRKYTSEYARIELQ